MEIIDFLKDYWSIIISIIFVSGTWFVNQFQFKLTDVRLAHVEKSLEERREQDALTATQLGIIQTMLDNQRATLGELKGSVERINEHLLSSAKK